MQSNKTTTISKSNNQARKLALFISTGDNGGAPVEGARLASRLSETMKTASPATAAKSGGQTSPPFPWVATQDAIPNPMTAAMPPSNLPSISGNRLNSLPGCREKSPMSSQKPAPGAITTVASLSARAWPGIPFPRAGHRFSGPPGRAGAHQSHWFFPSEYR